MQEIPSNRLLKPTSWKFAYRQDGRINPFRSCWPRLCRTDRVQTQDKERRKSVYFAIGRANLTWNELEEVLLDVEVAVNNRPLSYVKDDVQLPVLTPFAMMFGQPRLVPEESTEEGDADLRKRMKYLRWCKEVLWNR